MNEIIQCTLRTSTNTIKITRCICILSGNYKENKKSNGDFVPIYKFPYIVPCSLINRLKVYQTALTAISVPVALGLNQLNHISTGALQFTAALGISGCLVLYSLGYLTQNFIGFIYYNEDKNLVKISYIDFWGKRRDIEIPSKDIIPINELSTTPLDGLFFTFRRFSTSEKLKLNIQFGIVLDKEKMKQIL